ncbi:5409_t:CDS:2, partial [Ambispora leptoticha]
TPTTELQTNLLFEITKKINSYYSEETKQNSTTFSLFGFVSEIQEKKFKEGKRRGQPYLLLKMGEPKKELIQARKEDLPPEKLLPSKEISPISIHTYVLNFKSSNKAQQGRRFGWLVDCEIALNPIKANASLTLPNIPSP